MSTTVLHDPFRAPRALAALALVALWCAPLHAALRVVATTADLAAIAKEVGGEHVAVESLIGGKQDPHFIMPRPSLALTLQQADLLVHVGMELELAWLPQLLDQARNRAIAFGAPGNVDASKGLDALEVPGAGADRSQGDIHRLGNPHYWLDPLNGLVIARNILDGLLRVDGDRRADYERGFASFHDRLWNACFGAELVKIVGGRKLEREWQAGTLSTFLASRDFEDRPLAERLQGFAGRMKPFAGRNIVTFHKTWSYFARRFDLKVVDYVEPLPGVQPSRRHLETLIATMQSRRIDVIVQANVYQSRASELVAKSAPARLVIAPISCGGVEGVDRYLDLLDHLVKTLGEALKSGANAGEAPKTDDAAR